MRETPTSELIRGTFESTIDGDLINARVDDFEWTDFADQGQCTMWA